MSQQSQAVDLYRAVRKTTIIEPRGLSRELGCEVVLAAESFQHTGSFKFRAAYNLAAGTPDQILLTGSSGNFGQALAYACSLVGKNCIVVMPSNSSKVKIEATRQYGAQVDLVDTSVKSRQARVSELKAQYPEARVVSPFDEPLVIEGNASLGAELAACPLEFDYVVVPIGGGGLISGIIKGLRESSRRMPEVIGAEPALGNDASRSLAAGSIVSMDREPATIADGARTIAIGKHNWEYIRDGVARIVEVPEDNIAAAVRLLFLYANLKSEPTGALSTGAVLASPESFRGKRCLLVVSGGNVEPELYARLISPLD